jgi:hypothetical protein
LFIVEFNLPGVRAEDVDLDLECNLLKVKAERPINDAQATELIAAERPRGSFRGQLFLATTSKQTGCSRVRRRGAAADHPVSEQSKPHEIKIAKQLPNGRPSSADPELDQRVVARRPTLDRLSVTVDPLTLLPARSGAPPARRRPLKSVRTSGIRA